MGKYTTEVRSICESKGGYEESQGLSKIEEVLDRSWNKIFYGDFPIFDEKYRSVLCKKILRHYYTKEIGAETVALWEFWLNNRLTEIMPYYNKLYESELLSFNPLNDVNLTRTHKRNLKEDNTESNNGERKATGSNTGNETKSLSSDTTNRDLYSDTPQGALTKVESEEYLTNARKVSGSYTEGSTGNHHSNYSDNETSKNSKTGNINSTEDYLESVVGKQGTTDYSTLLMKYRETFLNIDVMIINELTDLFMNLW